VPASLKLVVLCGYIRQPQGAPTAEEAGFVDSMDVVEIGGDRVTVFRQGMTIEQASGA